jgi:hypothetical protein
MIEHGKKTISVKADTTHQFREDSMVVFCGRHKMFISYRGAL